jgi:hypothetical protein
MAVAADATGSTRPKPASLAAMICMPESRHSWQSERMRSHPRRPDDVARQDRFSP